VTRRKQLEEQFLQAQKMEAVGRLAGGVAHDFNNLLTVIGGFSEVVLDRLGADHQLSPLVRQIQQATERAAGLTQQLLAFSRKQMLQPKIFNLNILVSSIKSMLRHLVGEEIRLDVVLDSGLGHIRADPGQIEQVIMNLVVNARDAMPQGGKLTIMTANVAFDASYSSANFRIQPGSYVQLSVSDTGIGMDKEVLSHLFEPFFTTKPKGQGTGLGLATVYGIVKQSGGYIWVESEVGRGSTFHIYLPRVDELPAGEEQGSLATESLRGTETILLVEDEEMVRTLARDLLQSHGYWLLEANNGEEALRVSEQYPDPIHLLLTDIVMPGMRGTTLAERLRAQRPSIKILFMSGYTEQFQSDHSFLPKPFSSRSLLTKVREVLDRGG